MVSPDHEDDRPSDDSTNVGKDDAPRGVPPRRFQFSLLSLLGLVTGVGFLLGLLRLPSRVLIPLLGGAIVAAFVVLPIAGTVAIARNWGATERTYRKVIGPVMIVFMLLACLFLGVGLSTIIAEVWASLSASW